MSKMTKFFKHPVLFFQDAHKKKIRAQSIIYIVGFSTWKQFMRKYFSEKELIFLPKDVSEVQFNYEWKSRIANHKGAEIFVWGYKAPNYILQLAKKENSKVRFVEDGFVRSIELGATKAPPMSLCIDKKTPYFDCRQPSDLEDMIQNYDFSANPDLLKRADELLERFIKTGISKYNHIPETDVEKIYGPKKKNRILIIGQVQDDASIIYGASKKVTDKDIIALAVKENPNSQIIYKVHPDVAAGFREGGSQEYMTGIELSTHNLPLHQSFHQVDAVYTISSLAGFEAAIRGIKVITLGAPFYSGWGFTDDRDPLKRRTAKRSALEVFALAYLEYAKYFNPETGEKIQFEDVLDILEQKIKLRRSAPEKIKTAAIAKPTPTSTTTVKTASKAVKPASKSIVETEVPDWFNSYPSQGTKAIIDQPGNYFLYFPWIAEHGNTLISKIDGGEDYSLIPFDMVSGIEDINIRRQVSKFARDNPSLYRKLVIRRLTPLGKKISGFIFTFDWAPAMRLIAEVCRELNIPTILIPHEAAFVDRQKYYWDSITYASVPITDMILSWGGMQQEIFVERGYPENRVSAVGAPKFDAYSNYQSLLSREQFCNIYGLENSKKIILFAAQPLDSQLNLKVARESQRTAIADIMAYCKEHDCQLIIRMPPSKDEILTRALREEISQSNLFVIDEAILYLVNAEEAICHSDIVTSINSTMLFEAILSGKPSLSVKYVEFDQIWEQAGIPAAKTIEEMSHFLNVMLSGEWQLPQEGMGWAAERFGIGEFDGLASDRIRDFLWDITKQAKYKGFSFYKSPVDRLLSAEPLDVIAIPSNTQVLATSQKYLSGLLKARTIVNSSQGINNMTALASADLFFQWGITPSMNKTRSRTAAKHLGRPVVLLEDGFIRSVDIGLSGEAGLSVIVDDTTAHYDASSTPSRLERLLQSGPTLTPNQLEQAHKGIEKIVKNRVSKYNHALDAKALGGTLKIGRAEAPKLLIIDQRFGDQSVESGLASEETYDKMLQDALYRGSQYDVLIKRHPDAIKGGKSSYYTDERISKYLNICSNIHLIDFDINPYSLFDIVSEVYVGTSGMGFEALMAGKKVHCYGVPFYAGWGVTQDQITLERRNRVRSIEEIFYFSYIESSRYFDPDLNQLVSVEGIVDYIVKHRGWQISTDDELKSCEDEYEMSFAYG